MKTKLDPDSDNHDLNPKTDTSKADSSTASPTSGRAAKVGGPLSFEGAVEGRTGRQTYMAWRKALQAKGASNTAKKEG
ncbi:uncharacterized protein EHS24_009223 [Apiotrichum porosum]|uniref:Uncharacterized protein n=1 Tax=Apiotrichum porosum TaxID=105984 RepID=A0A427XP75_9TREE|nr:uncharacterized protein EHS24_009223 [Apiotrichum porosum]RSH80639.1 hypothetical protein EHS24_009223 [Apiotrichum porosum]